MGMRNYGVVGFGLLLSIFSVACGAAKPEAAAQAPAGNDMQGGSEHAR